MTWKHGLFAAGYFLFFFLCAFAMIWWQRRQRKMRLPFGEETRLLRGPGETQLKLVREHDEKEFLWIAIGAGIPAFVFTTMAGWTKSIPTALQLPWLVLSLAVFIGLFIGAARLFSRKMRESSDRYLGYFGERVVAEHLEPLKQQGWRIFHDVPATANGSKFNLDHVAVGQQGVFAIETKTRRKGGARPGFDDHKVFFDGRGLVWPWGEDNHGLEQAERNAVWLANTLKDDVGERFHVTPILTLPGWFVEMKPSRDSRICRVTNPKGLAKLLPTGPAVLDARQIANIVAKLEARCRNVEY